MFWPLAEHQAMNTPFLSTLHWHTVLDWLHQVTFPPMPYAPPRPQGSSTPGKIAMH